MTLPSTYVDRFDPRLGYQDVMFMEGVVLQGPELNELQSIQRHRTRRLAEALFKDGAVVRGAGPYVDSQTGQVTLEVSDVYAAGHVWPVDAATLVIPLDRLVGVGIRLVETVITALEDPGLLDPIRESDNYQQPGAFRRRLLARWGWDQDGQDGAFYVAYRCDHGVLLSNAPPPAMDGVSAALARYDRESNGGCYVSAGLTVSYQGKDGSEQAWSVAEGVAHIDGYEVMRQAALRVRVPDDPDLQSVDVEPHAFNAATGGSQRIDLNHGPVAAVDTVRATVRVVETVVHGVYSGCRDALANGSVVQIVLVKQGGTTFTAGTDYLLTADQVDWTPQGSEPAVGSSYTVTYDRLASLTPTAVDGAGFTVAGPVQGTQVLVTYRWKLPRIDRLVLSREGLVSRVRGVANAWAPAKPPVPAGVLLLATITQRWSTDPPAVVNDGLRSVPFSDIEKMRTDIVMLHMLVANDRLQTRAGARDPAAKRGVFVDAFADEQQRDAGVAQDAAIVAGELTLPITATVADAPTGKDQRFVLTYVLEAVLSQPLRTTSMPVNPYEAFDPLPALVTLTPAADQWTQTDSAAANYQFDQRSVNDPGYHGSGLHYELRRTESSTAIISRRPAETLRQIAIQVAVKGFGPGEHLTTLLFDGVSVPFQAVTADQAGALRTQFTIPAGIPTGTKKVELLGAGGSYGSATFTGSGTVETRQLRVVDVVETHFYDPLAQTFALDKGRHIGGVDLWFTAVGAKPVRVQIRETSVGFPSRVILADSEIAASQIRTDGQPTRIVWGPLWCDEGVEYALVILTDDPGHAVSVAELGKYDAIAQTWITRQPYAVGVLLSSSNASTWTAHQDRDLSFRLLGARFTATTREVALGNITATQVSDMIALARVERPAADTDITMVFTDQAGNQLKVVNGQVVTLQARLSGPVAVKAVLTGTDLRSPVLYPGVQAVLGVVKENATYITRQIDCLGATRLIVACEVLLAGTASVKVEAKNAQGGWVLVPVTGGGPIGEGWQEVTCGLSPFVVDATAVRLTLTGGIVSRPRVRALQVVAL
jgi:hypothetical protein